MKIAPSKREIYCTAMAWLFCWWKPAHWGYYEIQAAKLRGARIGKEIGWS